MQAQFPAEFTTWEESLEQDEAGFHQFRQVAWQQVSYKACSALR